MQIASATQIVLAIISDRSSSLVGQQKARPPTNQNLLFYSLLVKWRSAQLSPSNTLVVEQSRSAELLEKHTSDVVDTRDLDLSFALKGKLQKHLVQIPQKMHYSFLVPEPIIITRAFQGSGTINVSGSAGERQLDHLMTLSIPSHRIASAEESMHQQIFRSGSVYSHWCCRILLHCKPVLNTVLYDITGTAEPIIRTQAFQGSGTITVSVNLVSRSFFTSMVLVELASKKNC